MKRYRNLKGDSGVSAFEIAERSIIVQFRNGDSYEYDYRKPGRKSVEEMKRLAVAGSGLSTYISQHVRENYARKLQ